MQEVVDREFRRSEEQLDQLLAEAAAALTEASIHWADNSVRSYAQKESYLSWRYTFEREWQKDLLVHQVRVWLTCSQPAQVGDDPFVSIVRRVEVFRAGQPSSIDRRFETRRPLPALLKTGLSALVINEIQLGTSEIDVVP